MAPQTSNSKVVEQSGDSEGIALEVAPDSLLTFPSFAPFSLSLSLNKKPTFSAGGRILQ